MPLPPVAIALADRMGWRARRASATVRRFHRLYYDNQARTWLNTRWRGVQVLKCPLDLWIYQELLVALRPELVIETGTAAGGSALYLASCMELLGHGRVVTVDAAPQPDLPAHERITYLTASSTDPDTIASIRREAEACSPVLVLLDSDHTRDHVLAELRAYAPLVTPGSYVIVEDTNVNGRPVEPQFGPGPAEAVDAFLAEGAPFVRDATREKFYLTFNPGGYLRRLDESEAEARR
jgi:cephalosporin hydroxylase